MWSGREETNTKAVAKPMSSTASDTSHCILQEPVYPVRQMKGALFCTHM